MDARFWTNVRRLAGIAFAVLALAPAAASAQESWHPVFGTAPGGEDLAVIDGVPHVTWADASGVHVAKLASTGGRWENVGVAFRHTPGAAVHTPALTSDPTGAPWVTWTENDSGGTPQARVARFEGGRWREVVGGARPINLDIPNGGPSGAFTPRIIFFHGVPHVAYIQDTPSEFTLRVVRLNSNGLRWDDADAPLFAVRPAKPRLAVVGDRLYVAVNDTLGVPHVEVAALESDGSWTKLGFPDNARSLGDIANVGGRLVIGYSWPADRPEPGPDELRAAFLDPDDTWDQAGDAVAVIPEGTSVSPQGLAGIGNVPYTAAVVGEPGSRQLLVSRYVRPRWQTLPNPSGATPDVVSALLAPGNGGVWLLYGQSSGGRTSYRLARFGGSPPGPPEPPRDRCGRKLEGTDVPDLLLGTRFDDSIFGHGGRDVIRAYGGNDCLDGGRGNDVLSGGSGNDFFRAGTGNDRIDGGPGRDDINGDPGNDRISGGPGIDEINAGPGNDTIYNRDGKDLIECGPGFDTLVSKPHDGRGHSCERVIARR
jgi:hypothetical protein